MPVARINDHDMYYEVHGAGTPVVVTGGWGTYCHGAVERLPAGLSDEHQLILYDHRGIGGSDDPDGVPASTDLYARDLLGLLDELSLESAHLVGLGGMGGCIVQCVAIQAPERPRSLVLGSTWGRADALLWHQLETMRVLHAEVDFWAYQRYVTTEATTAEYFNEHVETLLGPSGGWKNLNGNLAVHEKFIRACQGHDVLDRLDRIQAPTLITWCGRMNRLTGARLSRPLVDGITHAETLELADAPHSIHHYPEEKAKLARAILDFISRHEASE